MQPADETYHQVLDSLAHTVSHRLRKHVCTMLGLINLIKMESFNKSDCPQLLHQFQHCLDELDKYLREMGHVIHCEQQNRE